MEGVHTRSKFSRYDDSKLSSKIKPWRNGWSTRRQTLEDEIERASDTIREMEEILAEARRRSVIHHKPSTETTMEPESKIEEETKDELWEEDQRYRERIPWREQPIRLRWMLTRTTSAPEPEKSGRNRKKSAGVDKTTMRPKTRSTRDRLAQPEAGVRIRHRNN
jgi:hypothetical protein